MIRTLSSVSARSAKATTNTARITFLRISISDGANAAARPALDVGCEAALLGICEPKVGCVPSKIQLRQTFR